MQALQYLRKKSSFSLYISLCIAVSIAVMLLCLKVLARDPWLDEIMLFENFPLTNLLDSLNPLRLYNQAAPPLYSLLYGWTASFSVEAIRAVHFTSILIAAIFILARKERSILAIAIAVLSVLVSPIVIRYMYEIKHYGLEAIGALGIFSWYIHKDLRSGFGPVDSICLLVMTCLGISTLPVAALAFILYLVRKAWSAVSLKTGDAVWGSATVAGMFGYYYLIKHITVFQFKNFPASYAYTGFTSSIKQFIKSLLRTLPFGKVGLLGLVVLCLLLILTTSRMQRHLNLVVILACTILAFSLLAGMNLYPAKQPRHVIWASSMVWLVLYESWISCVIRPSSSQREISLPSPIQYFRDSLQSVVKQRIIGVIMIVTALLLTYPSFLNLRDLALYGPARFTYDAITYLRQSQIQNIALYGGAQTLTSFYSKRYPDLASKSFFGEMPYESSIALPPNSLDVQSLDVEPRRPGAFARFWQPNADQDGALKDLLSIAPKNKKFLLFDYTFQPLTDAKKDVLKASSCEVSQVKDFIDSYVAELVCKPTSSGN